MNIEQPTSNLGSPITLGSISVCGANASNEYADQFIRLAQRPLDIRLVATPFFSFHKPEPSPSLAEFLEANLQLVDEVVGRFGRLGLAVIRIRRRAAAQYLAAHMAACSRVWQSLRQVNHV